MRSLGKNCCIGGWSLRPWTSPDETSRRASRTPSGPRVGSMLAKAIAISECFGGERGDLVVRNLRAPRQPLVYREHHEADVSRSVVLRQPLRVARGAGLAEVPPRVAVGLRAGGGERLQVNVRVDGADARGIEANACAH